MLSNNEFPAGLPPAEWPMHLIELIPGAAPRHMRPHCLYEEVDRQVDELLKRGKAQESTGDFGQNLVLAREKMDDRVCVSNSVLRTRSP